MHLNDKERRQVKEQLTAMFLINNFARAEKSGKGFITMENCNEYGIACTIMDATLLSYPYNIYGYLFPVITRNELSLQVYIFDSDKKNEIRKIILEFVQSNKFLYEINDIPITSVCYREKMDNPTLSFISGLNWRLALALASAVLADE